MILTKKVRLIPTEDQMINYINLAVPVRFIFNWTLSK